MAIAYNSIPLNIIPQGDVKISIVQQDNAIFINYHLKTRGSNAGCLFVYAKGEPVLMS
jgi:hypothetical protein